MPASATATQPFKPSVIRLTRPASPANHSSMPTLTLLVILPSRVEVEFATRSRL
ncbi:hypothetical protein [Lysobacter gummosus]|uniref:hypothetical protein n=1 Tax=Lysobacter gummosus TaxID=262324 RepID=UPI0036434B67